MEFIIVDDSVFDQFTQEKLLLKSGLTETVRTFSSAQQAIEYLRTQDSDMPDTVILLDLQMPGLNGFEFTEQYGQLPKAVRKRIRLFMISSTVDVSDIEQAEANPYIIQLLPKPLEIPLLRELLKS
ncbi:CheY-like chemotaxis protein [Dyadobacter sp. BE34]|uniref:CheY-like chemotaxis protein n=1 Tax=Dyadobacter fermentans TaxID=94254 RepID=A0ABU1QYC3_9BACT|nr:MULTISPECIES: response regulator [Dyadobacter]MDR6806130.1 CheY-like chemotaxis protein [Dyadobacter fermentans]MDR7043871.1 CheY-like chemotaxis protein [Dyadobacter sp. BE242]MDR7198182.1 CheY-like chemotaxis protein [Dyadobacter sp. BE34]MDR7216145.1 CheY-like chemotaxis protein [Dyadobacter sp. BE31]MDR7264329.1 CheY-like chemotaxis protein [Dyadobacter sp. BE32]